MKSLEIPYNKDKPLHYRIFEITPAVASWLTLMLPFALSRASSKLTAFFVIAYLLIWFVKAIALDVRVLQGWSTMKNHIKTNWLELLEDLEKGEARTNKQYPKWHKEAVEAATEHSHGIKPSKLLHVAMIATYNESLDVIEPTILSVINSDYPVKEQVMLVIAYEQRGGPKIAAQSKALVKKYKHLFVDAVAYEHPADLPGEVVGKGGNITYAGHKLHEYCVAKKLDLDTVLVTSLDSDNRPHPKYLSALSYTYCASVSPRTTSYQPISMYTNNIWDAPAPMRVVATGNSFWMLVTTMRPHMLRNFSAHAQSLAALVDTNFWSVRTVVEDGHQFWRTYFRYDGKHEVYPIYVPIFQDAVLSTTYAKTLKAQFIQMRRWAWGVSDIAYVIHMGFFKKNKVPKLDLTIKLLRLVEGHWSWATAPLLLLFAAFIPLLFNPQDYAANQLPQIASFIQRMAMVGIGVTLFLSIKTLPAKPARYKNRRTIWMILQWFLLPVTTVTYSAFSGLYSQTRLMFGWYLDKFDVTDKAVVAEDNTRSI